MVEIVYLPNTLALLQNIIEMTRHFLKRQNRTKQSEGKKPI